MLAEIVGFMKGIYLMYTSVIAVNPLIGIVILAFSAIVVFFIYDFTINASYGFIKIFSAILIFLIILAMLVTVWGTLDVGSIISGGLLHVLGK